MYRLTILIGTCLALICGPVFAGDLRIDGAFASNATSGPPLEVNSNTLVPNLNAEFLDGKEVAAFATKAEVDAVYNEVLFTADDTFTVPSDVTHLEVTVTGAGGAGGGGADLSGGGGGGSGLVVATVVTVTPGESLTADVGAGGAGGAFVDGEAGEPSVLSADSGTWRVEAAGGGGGLEGTSNAGGNGGGGLFGGGGGGGIDSVGIGGSGIFAGGEDGSGISAGAGASGGAGGGEAGGGGGGGPGGGAGGADLRNGDPGTQPGAGGGGGGSDFAGGDGADGAILIRWVGGS